MTAKVIRRIVFGYTVDCFPGPLIVGCNQMKRKVERAGFDIAVSMEPLSELPPETDVLFVPLELAELAQQIAPQCRIEALDNFLNHPLYNALIAQLKEGREWSAAQRTAHVTNEEEGYIATYRGYQRIG